MGPSGHIVFAGTETNGVAGTGAEVSAVWAGPRDNLQVIARTGDPIVGLPGDVRFRRVRSVENVGRRNAVVEAETLTPVVTRAGRIAFGAVLEGADVSRATDRAVLAFIDGALISVARVGDQAPGLPAGTLISRLDYFAFSDAGLVVHGSAGRDPDVLWFWDFDTLSLLARSREPIVPPLPHCLLFEHGQTGLSINDSGTVAFRTRLIATGPTPACPGSAVLTWRNNTAGFGLALDTISDVPGMADTRFRDIGAQPHINDAGDIMVNAHISQVRTLPMRFGAWSAQSSGEIGLLALQHEWLAGDTSATLWPPDATPLVVHPASTSSGGTVLLATVLDEPASTSRTKIRGAILHGLARSPQPYASYTATGPNHLAVLAFQTGVAPGLDSAFVFRSLSFPHINRSGVIAFQAKYAPPPDGSPTQTPTTGLGIWRGDSAASLEPIAYEGMPLVVDGQATTLQSIEPATLLLLDYFAGATEGGRYTRLSDAGEMLFRGTTALRQQTAIMVAGSGSVPGDGGGPGPGPGPGGDGSALLVPMLVPILFNLLLDDD